MGSGDLPGLQSRPERSAHNCTKLQHGEKRLILQRVSHLRVRTSPQHHAAFCKANRHHNSTGSGQIRRVDTRRPGCSGWVTSQSTSHICRDGLADRSTQKPHPVCVGLSVRANFLEISLCVRELVNEAISRVIDTVSLFVAQPAQSRSATDSGTPFDVQVGPVLFLPTATSKHYVTSQY